MRFTSVMTQRPPFKGQRFLEIKYLLTKNLRESPQPPQPSLKSPFASRQGRIHKSKSSACTKFRPSRRLCRRRLLSQREISEITAASPAS